MGCHSLLQGIFTTQRSNPSLLHLLHWQVGSLPNGNPLQYSCLESPMDGRAGRAAVHGVGKSQTQLSDFTFTFHFHALEKEMATHSSVLAWRIPGMGEACGLPSMGLRRVGHYWNDLAAALPLGSKIGMFILKSGDFRFLQNLQYGNNGCTPTWQQLSGFK